MRGILTGVWILIFSCAGSATYAAIIFDSGTLHGSASSSAPSALLSVPPPVVMSVGTSHHYESSASFGFVSAWASGSAIMQNGSVSASGSTNLIPSSSSPFVGADTKGTITFHETTGEFLRGSLSMGFGTQYGNAGATVRNASNAVMLTVNAGPSVAPQALVATNYFPPGVYTLTWSHGTQSIVGTGGPSSMSFNFSPGVPEPAAISLWLTPLAMLLVRRRRCG